MTTKKTTKKITKKAVVHRIITSSLENRIKNVKTEDWVYVSPKDNMWTVRKDGATRATHVYKQRISAVNAAKRLVYGSQHSSQVIVYNLQGEISKIIK